MRAVSFVHLNVVLLLALTLGRQLDVCSSHVKLNDCYLTETKILRYNQHKFSKSLEPRIPFNRRVGFDLAMHSVFRST